MREAGGASHLIYFFFLAGAFFTAFFATLATFFTTFLVALTAALATAFFLAATAKPPFRETAERASLESAANPRFLAFFVGIASC